MEPLPTSQKVMTWLCMCPADKSTSIKKLIHYAGYTSVTVIMSLGGLLAGIGYIVKFAKTDFGSSLYAVVQVAGYLALLNLIIFGLINRHRIASIFTELSNIYNSSKNIKLNISQNKILILFVIR